MEDEKYYVIKKKAVPEVLLKVLEVQKLLDTRQAVSVMEAAENVGISRSSYYKYKDDIFPFYAKEKGKNITFVIEIKDQPGVMVSILEVFARYHANILTIHQSVPINGVATLTLSVDILPGEGDAEAMVETIEQSTGIHYLKILGRE